MPTIRDRSCWRAAGTWGGRVAVRRRALVLLSLAAGVGILADASRTLAASASAPAAQAMALAADARRLSGEELEALLEQARQAQRADLEAWHGYSFRRQVTREKLDRDGRVTDREILEFILTPLAAGFDERLVEVDGRIPNERQVDEHRRAARFSERYLQALGACDDEVEMECPDDDAVGDASSFGVQVPLVGRDFIHEGRETIEGIACHRLQLLELEPSKRAGARERVGAATVGTMWLSVEGVHVVRAELTLARAIPIFGGLSRLADLEIVVETGVAPGGARLPARITVRSDLRVLGFGVRKRNRFVYSSFEPASPETARALP